MAFVKSSNSGLAKSDDKNHSSKQKSHMESNMSSKTSGEEKSKKSVRFNDQIEVKEFRK